MSVSSTASDDPTVGLTTTHLHDGEVSSKQTTTKTEDSVFDISAEIDEEVKKVLQVLNKNDQEIDTRMDKIYNTINKIKEKSDN